MSGITVITVSMILGATVVALPVAPPPPGVMAPSSQLRGVSAPAGAPAPSAAGPLVDERGARGHFYYADSCDDCVYKGAQCGCGATVEYLACLTKHCHNANHSKFAAKCAAVATNCSSELDIVCSGPDSHCKGKYNQLSSGGIGLTLDLNGMEDDAFCGPQGKCKGILHMKAHIHNPPAQPMVPVLPVAAAPGPAPAPSSAPALAAATAFAQPIFLECGIPNVPDAESDSNNQTHWALCRAPLVGDSAGCDLPIFPTLDASGNGKEAYCVLTEGTEGNPPKRVTQPAWHLIANTHKKDPVEKSSKAWHGLW